MSLFGWALLAHLMYDLHWQGPYVAEVKRTDWFILVVHALTWALVVGAVLSLFGSLAEWHLPWLFITHFVVDAWKTRIAPGDRHGRYQLIDQGLHVLSLLVVVL